MAKALTIVQVPEGYQLSLEEYGEEVGAVFAWENEEQDDGISISIDIDGNLTDLSIDKSDEIIKSSSLSINEKRKRAEDFLLSHYPNVFQHFTFYRTNELSQATRFDYEQIVMDLPLEELSCMIDIDLAGNVVRSCYDGVKAIPEVPATLISKEKLIEEVQKNLDLQLKIINLYADSNDMEGEGLRLVYEPEQSFMKYKADVLKPTLTIEREVNDVETLIPLPALSITHKGFTNEEIIGITEQMEIIREVDMGPELGIVWRDRNWQSDETDLSIEGVFQRHTEDTVKAFISKESGKVKSFLWFNERQGKRELSRDACYLIEIEFLQTVIPEYYRYLQLIVREEDEEEDDDFQKVLFSFEMNNDYGVPVELGMVTISVNRTTGYIDYFSGSDIDLAQLVKIPPSQRFLRLKLKKYSTIIWILN